MTQMKPAATPQRSAAEQELLDWVEKVRGEKLTEQQANLALKQARALGERAIGYS